MTNDHLYSTLFLKYVLKNYFQVLQEFLLKFFEEIEHKEIVMLLSLSYRIVE